MNLPPKKYSALVSEIRSFNPIRYGKSRNFKNGAVSYLSPYISRGVISLNEIAKLVFERYHPKDAYTFIKELAWRDYFQKVWEAKADEIFTDLKHQQEKVKHHNSVTAVVHAKTGIHELDAEIRSLYERGYLHNHIRMYIASVTCNIAGAHWFKPSQWMYYHLLDGDPASNALSWQWVAGSFSSKKYYCNQENINKYTGSKQQGSFLDEEYEKLVNMEVPEILKEKENTQLQTQLPKSECDLSHSIDGTVFIYNSFNLDQEWHKDKPGTRILLLEPSHFEKHPVSEKVMRFIQDQSLMIPDIRICVAEFHDVQQAWSNANFIFKKHPTTAHYRGIEETPLSLFPSVQGYFPSFSAYWKRAEKEMFKMDKNKSLFD